uniref:SFRICE_014034 n=1 Tax=Spodoptera frugiperda TaxID=7108 RepID=A0A2H1V1N0_SPOFR
MLKLVVLSCLVAAAAAGALLPYAAPLAYTAPLAYSAPFAYSAPILAPYAPNYRGPLSLAPGQPANILGADGRPLDTLDVNLDRSAHYTAKALDNAGLHILKKRSAPLIAPISRVAVAAPLVHSYAAPLAYSAPLYSSRLALVVLSCLVAAAAAGALLPYAAPLAYTAPLAYSAPFAYAAPVVAPYASNYRGPLSLAPGQPANILAADGRPLDTLDVNLDRSAHFTAKALDHAGLHILKKRSAPLIAPISRVAVAAPLVHSYAAPLAYSAPVYSSRLAVAPISYAAAPVAHYWK